MRLPRLHGSDDLRRRRSGTVIGIASLALAGATAPIQIARHSGFELKLFGSTPDPTQTAARKIGKVVILATLCNNFRMREGNKNNCFLDYPNVAAAQEMRAGIARVVVLHHAIARLAHHRLAIRLEIVVLAKNQIKQKRINQSLLTFPPNEIWRATFGRFSTAAGAEWGTSAFPKKTLQSTKIITIKSHTCVALGVICSSSLSIAFPSNLC